MASSKRIGSASMSLRSTEDDAAKDADFARGFRLVLGNREIMEQMKATLLGDILNEINALKQDIHRIRLESNNKEEVIATLKAEVDTVTQKCDALEQYSRRNSLRISGIPEKGNEDVGETTLRLFNTVMNIVPPIDIKDIDRVHRTGAKIDGRNRQVLVKFATYRNRQRVYRAKSALKPGNQEGARPLTLADFMTDGQPPAAVASGSGVETGPDINHTPGLRIFINEDLTAQRASLLYQARQLKKKREINDCWSVDGQILIKGKCVCITCVICMYYA